MASMAYDEPVQLLLEDEERAVKRESSTPEEGEMGVSTTTTTSSMTLASKRVVYVGGLADSTTVPLVRAAFVPFGTLASVDMPMDYVKGTHRGFAFVEFVEADDAQEAVYNVDGAELLGRVLKVSLANPNQANKLSSSSGSGSGGPHRGNPASQAVWTSDEWFQQNILASANGDGPDEAHRQQQAKDDVQALR